MWLIAKGLLTTPGLIAVGVMSVLTLRACDVSNQRKIGAERVTAQIEKKVEANAQKAEGVRNSVQSVPANSLRDKWTRE